MTKVLQDSIEKTRKQINDLRAFLYQLESRPAALAIAAADSESLKDFNEIVQDGDAEELKVWIHDQNEKSLGEMNMRALREKARSLHIQHYYILTRTQLVNAIARKNEELERLGRRDEGGNAEGGRQSREIRSDCVGESGEIPRSCP